MAKDGELYPPLARKFHDAESERLISRFWRDNQTFEKSIAQREGAPDFVFYEGPPTANGKPGVHHVIARLSKDIVCRYKTMTGHRVLRKAGWDTHGLPVERSVEKELGIQGAQAIEAYGIAAFNAKCRESVWSCKGDWDEFTEALGYWIDLDHPYITYADEYIETVWWILNRFHAADMLYRGHKVVPYCPVCATPLSSHEVANSYRTVSDPSVYVKLKACDSDEYFLTWTTTPWTLPSNVALAVGADHDYVKVRHGDDVLILAEARLPVLESEVKTELLDRMRGSDLVGRCYEQLLPLVPIPGDKEALKVVAADFVTLDTGTGIVHLAPAFGEDDFAVGQRDNLAVLQPVDVNGRFTAEAGPYAGTPVKKADRQIVGDLRAAGKLLAEATYSHEYPFHDRCNNALIYYAMPSWFIRTSAMREQLVTANRDVAWSPPEVGSGRFGNWLAGNVDWALSRNRFWGTPLNVWVCAECGTEHLPTSRSELTELTGSDHSGADLHRPTVDEITFGCVRDGCGGTMHRTPEVIDCWFDAGSMPFAQYHYPFADKALFENQFPADFISEGIDQTRGWFYTMLVIGTFLFGRCSYRRCLVNELVLDKKGKKMSKSLGNSVDPMDIMRVAGADPLRWYMVTCNPIWTPIRFDRDGVKEAQRKLLATLENTYQFFALYANLDGYRPEDGGETEPDLLDRWVLSRLQTVTAAVRQDLDDLHLTRAGKRLGAFVIEDVSNWYVRLNRRRFWKGDLTREKRTAFATLHTLIETSLRLLAPFVPFTSEEIYRALVAHRDGAASVHLTDYPESDATLQDLELESRMAVAQEIVGLGRSLRQEARLRTRQPLGRLVVHAVDDRVTRLLADERLVEHVADELNVKRIETVDDPGSVAAVAAKANFRALGPRFAQRAPQAAASIAAMTAEQIGQLRRDGRVALDLDGESTEFGYDEIQISETGVAPFIATGAGGLTVALDVTLTDELRAEGLCREVVNRVQNLRKKSGLEVADRIVLNIAGDAAVVAAVERFAERIAAETLATRVASDADLHHREAFDLDGLAVEIALGKLPAAGKEE
jgi:isoleucyl-tRNA synthetase